MAESLTSLRPLLPLLEHEPLGVFSDIDGTLSPIVPRPEDARISAQCRSLLEGLIEQGVRVGLITGRNLEDARSMAGIAGVAYAASHGFELFVDGQAERPVILDSYVEAARRVIAETSGLAFEGLAVEDKGAMVAFHYRNAQEQERARAAILEAIRRAPSAARFEVQENRKVIELRPPLRINKGTALETLALRLGVYSVVCMGDDRTDIDMFYAARRWRAGGKPAAVVAANSSEVTVEVLDAADYVVDGVAGVEWLLRELFNALRARRR